MGPFVFELFDEVVVSGGQSSVACPPSELCLPQVREEPLGSRSPADAWGQAACGFQGLSPT